MKNEVIRRLVLDFLEAIIDGYKNTNYANDRLGFAEDLTLPVEWLLIIENKGDVDTVMSQLLSDQTQKYFFNIWRQGEYGQRAANSFSRLFQEAKRCAEDAQ